MHEKTIIYKWIISDIIIKGTWHHLSLLISYIFGIFSIVYKSDSIIYRNLNAIQYTFVTLINVFVLLNINPFYCCKKEKGEKAKKEIEIKIDQQHKNEID